MSCCHLCSLITFITAQRKTNLTSGWNNWKQRMLHKWPVMEEQEGAARDVGDISYRHVFTVIQRTWLLQGQKMLQNFQVNLVESWILNNLYLQRESRVCLECDSRGSRRPNTTLQTGGVLKNTLVHIHLYMLEKMQILEMFYIVTKATWQHQSGSIVPDTGAHAQQQCEFVMWNSENTMKGSDSTAQDTFQWSKRTKRELILGFVNMLRES